MSETLQPQPVMEHEHRPGFFARVLLALIRVYQCTLSHLIGRHCRHQPTCSNYTAEAIAKHGAIRGSWLGLKRIVRCHPWGTSGYDPVP